MIDPEALMRAAAAEDAARVLERAASDISRVSGSLDAISANTLGRMTANLRTIAKLKRPRIAPQPVAMPSDLKDLL